jgi:hypothetical protein
VSFFSSFLAQSFSFFSLSVDLFILGFLGLLFLFQFVKLASIMAKFSVTAGLVTETQYLG